MVFTLDAGFVGTVVCSIIEAVEVVAAAHVHSTIFLIATRLRLENRLRCAFASRERVDLGQWRRHLAAQLWRLPSMQVMTEKTDGAGHHDDENRQ